MIKTAAPTREDLTDAFCASRARHSGPSPRFRSGVWTPLHFYISNELRAVCRSARNEKTVGDTG
jgi:hypothetical protein